MNAEAYGEGDIKLQFSTIALAVFLYQFSFPVLTTKKLVSSDRKLKRPGNVCVHIDTGPEHNRWSYTKYYSLLSLNPGSSQSVIMKTTWRDVRNGTRR